MGYEANRRIEFDNDDMEDIQKRFDFYIEGITPRITFSGNVGYKLESNNYTVRGVGPSHQKNEMTIMMKGRFLNGLDIENKERNDKLKQRPPPLKNSSPDSKADFSEKLVFGIWRFILSRYNIK